MVVVAGVFAWIYFRRGAAAQREATGAGHDVPIKNPFSLTAAAKFAAFFTVVLLIAKIVQEKLPAESIYVVAALATRTSVTQR